MRRSSSIKHVFQATCVTLIAFACSSANDGASSGINGSTGGGVNYNTGGSVTTGPGCGDGRLDANEDCDQSDLNGWNCASATANALPNGVLRCNVDCTYDTSGCTTSGNGTGGAGGTQGAGGSGNTGNTTATGGTASTGGTSGSTGGTTGSGTTPPNLPTATQTCPNIPSGSNQTVTFLGSQVSIWAGPTSKPGGPLLLYWHATGTNSGEAVSAFGGAATNDVVANGGVVASFTNTVGTGTNTGNGVWYTDDFNVADEVVACAIQQHQIDTRRIYSAGFSAGGLQTGTASFVRSGYVASVVVYSGGVVVSTPNQNPANVPAALCAHGPSGTDFNTSDYYILNFGQFCVDYLNNVKNRGGFTVDCPDTGNHINTTQRFAVGPAAWQFLKDHAYGQVNNTLPAGAPSYCYAF